MPRCDCGDPKELAGLSAHRHSSTGLSNAMVASSSRRSGDRVGERNKVHCHRNSEAGTASARGIKCTVTVIPTTFSLP